MSNFNGVANIVALPSVSSSLNSLPKATCIQNVHIHPNMSARRADESKAKLQIALSKTASAYASQNQPPLQPPSPSPSTSSDDSESIMFKAKTRFAS